MTTDPTTGEIVAYQPQTLARVDMRDRVTDSWTDVLEHVADLASKIANTEFVPDGLRGSVPKVAAAILHGRELGLPPMTALSSIHVIKGKAGLSAEVMRSLILQAGHEFEIHESNSTRCVMKARRRRTSADWQTFTYTMADAERAGDVKSNPNYRTRPAEMLLARCTTRMARTLFADVIHGLRSTEELEDMTEDAPAQVIQQPASSPTVRRQTRREAPRAELAGPQQPEQPTADPEPAEAAPEPAQPAEAVRRQTRREQPRGRQERPRGTDEGEASPAGTLLEEEVSPSGEESTPADDRGIDQTEPAPDEAPARGPKISAAQRGTIQMHMTRLEITDREERLYWTTIAAGRPETKPISSTNELTKDEASDAIDRLQRLRDRAALEDMGAALAEGDDQ